MAVFLKLVGLNELELVLSCRAFLGGSQMGLEELLISNVSELVDAHLPGFGLVGVMSCNSL